MQRHKTGEPRTDTLYEQSYMSFTEKPFGMTSLSCFYPDKDIQIRTDTPHLSMCLLQVESAAYTAHRFLGDFAAADMVA